MDRVKQLLRQSLTPAERRALRQAIETSTKPAEQVSARLRREQELQRREDQAAADAWNRREEALNG